MKVTMVSKRRADLKSPAVSVEKEYFRLLRVKVRQDQLEECLDLLETLFMVEYQVLDKVVEETVFSTEIELDDL